MPIAKKVTDLVGGTPLYELARTPTSTRLLLKLETMNVTGTAKIRMARAMIDDAERRGLLRPGGHIIESTSGNTGLGLAAIAAERGYRFTAVVDHHASSDKLRAMQAMGANLVYVPNQDDTLATSAREDLAAQLAREECATAKRTGRQPNTYFTQQHNNDSNALGYYALADELLDELGNVDVIVSAVGTGGSLFGTARRLRERQPSPPLLYGVEPVGSIAFGGCGCDYWQSGTGTPEGADPGKIVAEDMHLLTEGVKVGDIEAFATVRRIAKRSGLMLGGSTGGAIFAALERIDTFPAGSTVVTIVCDGGEKYLDTIFNDDWMDTHKLVNRATDKKIRRLLERYAL